MRSFLVTRHPSPLSFFGGHKAVVRPDPIPNSAVKHSLADGSSPIGSARVGCRQIFSKSRNAPRFGFLLERSLFLKSEIGPFLYANQNQKTKNRNMNANDGHAGRKLAARRAGSQDPGRNSGSLRWNGCSCSERRIDRQEPCPN